MDGPPIPDGGDAIYSHPPWTHAFTLRSPADFYVAEMDRHDTVLRKALAANFAINADPGCIEAHLFMGLRLMDRDYGMLHLQRAVETGDQL